eukprot:scaffold116700_cov27-Phaeocystis_antarctica.AAC.1
MRCSKAVVRAGRDKGGGGTGVISHGAAAHLHWVDRKMAEAAREGYGVAVAVPASDAFLLQFRLAQLARLARLVGLRVGARPGLGLGLEHGGLASRDAAGLAAWSSDLAACSSVRWAALH